MTKPGQPESLYESHGNHILLKSVRILVVEDERKTASFVKKALEAESFAVDVASNGNDGLNLAQITPYDAVVLDIMLPGRDGLGVLKQLRDRRSNVPVLLLSARGAVEERVEGLNAGADDYLAKPFALAELLARVRALVRRNDNRSVLLQLGNLTVNTVARQVTRGDRAIELSAREYRLLEFLLRSQGRVCSRMQILEKVWDYDFDPGTNLVDVYVRRVRDKLDVAGEKPLLHTVRGVGYVMKEAG